MTGRIVVAGSMAQKPCQGGHTWVFLQYLLGLQRLGWDVLFLDRLTPAMFGGDRGGPVSTSGVAHLRYFVEVMERFGLATNCSLFGESGDLLYGRDRRTVLAHVREAELLLNVMGFLDDEEILAAARRRVFLDIDPGFGQMWHALGWADVFAGHDTFVTIGRNLGREGCTVPDCGLPWITTNQPIVLEQWPAWPPAQPGAAFTTVGTWRGRYAPIEYGGERYGLRVHSFRELAALPRLCDATFELALAIDPTEAQDLALLNGNGWRLVDPRRVAADPTAYQGYITRSRGELMIAKDVYVRSRSGWFSDRSICYLASGRPVVAMDTALDGHYPTGEGLLAFGNLEEARAAVEEVVARPLRHARAARCIAEECFDSDRVLGRLLDHLGVGSP